MHFVPSMILKQSHPFPVHFLDTSMGNILSAASDQRHGKGEMLTGEVKICLTEIFTELVERHCVSQAAVMTRDLFLFLCELEVQPAKDGARGMAICISKGANIYPKLGEYSSRPELAVDSFNSAHLALVGRGKSTEEVQLE